MSITTFIYPPGVASVDPSVGAINSPIPASAALVGGEDSSGDLQPLEITANGLKVDIAASVLPSGAATSANQVTANNSLSSIDTKLTSPLTTKITDGAGIVNTKQLGTALTNTDVGLVSNTVIHGLTTGGGGGYVDVKVTPSGALVTDTTISSSVLPTGAATETTLSALNTKVTTVDTDDVTITSSVLPTGASTEATLSALNTKVTTVDTDDVTVTSSVLPTGASTEATLSALNAKVTAVNTGAVTVSSSVLPTGAATESTLSAMNSKMLIGSGSGATALRVAFSNDSIGVVRILDSGSREATMKGNSALPVPQDNALVVIQRPDGKSPRISGYSKANAPLYRDYVSNPVTTSAYVELIASTSVAIDFISIFDSSGQAMILAVGAAASEIDQLYIPPGGGDFRLNIPSGSRVSIKALTADATSGYVLVNLLGGN